MIVRKMRMDDLPQVAAIEAECSPNPWSQRAFHSELIASTVSQPLVVDWKREVIGFIVPWYVADELQIANLAVKPAYRNRGVARMLLLQALKTAKEKSCQKAILEVRESNTAARSLYQALGFVEDGVRRHYYRSGNEHAILMSKDISIEGD